MKIPEYKALLKKKPKYRNKSLVVDDMFFPSEKQADRFGDLRLLEKHGHIKDLKREVSFPLHVNGMLICTYRADAVYVDKGKVIVEDTKGCLTQLYKIKRNLMKAVLNIEILET